MELTFDKTKLEQQIEELPSTLRPAFAAACAQRMAPAYAKYCLRIAGDATLFQKILDRLWDDLTGQQMFGAEVEEKIKQSMALLPSEDAERFPESAAADDAAAALAYSLRCRATGSSEEAVWAAARAYEALDNYVSTHENIDLNAEVAESRVLSHPLVQSELARQSRDLSQLRDGSISVAELRNRSRSEASELLP